MNELTLTEIQARCATGELTAAGLVEHYLRRIAALDAAGPMLRSVIEINPDAAAIAEALDAERRERGPRGPLHGVPVLLKDNIATADRMQTTAGSLALVGARPAQDATVAGRLRAAGAVILGKTNLSEWANFRSTHSVSGWSSRGGQTRNPYAPERSPCGSSSGSGAAVAADLAAVAVGTETDGSIICPSHANGIVGLKPTLGLVSRAGIIPIAHSQDTAGPMARTVTDAALLLAALAGPDPRRDPATAACPPAPDYTAGLRSGQLDGVRIGVARQFCGFNPQADAIFSDSVRALAGLGATLVDPVTHAAVKQLKEPEFEVLLYEFKADLNAYLAGLAPGGAVRTLADVIAFNDAHHQAVMPHFGQEIMLMAQERGDLTDERYLNALAACRRLARDEGLDPLFGAHDLAAIVAPSGGPAWLIDPICGDHHGGGSSTPAAVAGYPNLTVPAGYVHGLPVGISFIGPAWSEAELIRYAFAFEQTTQARRPPQFPPDISFGT